MSKEFKKKWLASRIQASKGRLSTLGSYQSSKFKSVVLTIDGQKVELDQEEYDEYVKGIKEAKIKSRKSIEPDRAKPGTNNQSITDPGQSLESLQKQYAELGKLLQEKIDRINESDYQQ